MATIIALGAARQHAAAAAGFDIRADGITAMPPLILYASEETHNCVTKAVELLGLGTRAIRRIPMDVDLRLSVPDLERSIRQDRAAGRLPFCIVANAGAVNTGAIDPLGDIANVAAQQAIWLHVDGAYGGLAAAEPTMRAVFTGLDRADSLALDAHKWLGVPVDCGALLFRDPPAVRDTYSLVPPYLRDAGADAMGWFSEYSIEQTRPFRALPVWATLSHLGRGGVAELVRTTCARARELGEMIGATADFELVAPVSTSICAFRYIDGSADLDRLNHDIPALVQQRGEVFLTGTTIGGRPTLRACLLNPATSTADLLLLLCEIRSAAELLGAPRRSTD